MNLIIKKVILYFAFGFYFFGNSMSYASIDVDDNYINNNIENLFTKDSNLTKSVKLFGTTVKYTAAIVCLLYAIDGVKKTGESIKLLMPVGADFKLTDLLKFPFRLMAFPFKAIDVTRCFFISGSFGAFFYVMHKIGA